VDSNSHARKYETDGYVEEDGEVVPYLPLYVWCYIAHVGIYQAAETDDGCGGGKRIADGYEIEHCQISTTRDGAKALMEHPEIDEGMKDVLMVKWITDTLQECAAIVQAHAIIAKERDTQDYNVPSIKRNLLFRCS